ncbi:hypothetical protein AB3N58_10215 [Leptospira sp. WS60.C2]
MIIYRTIAVTIIIGIAYIAIFTNVLKNLSNDQIITILSSFSGAAFAYFFVVLNEKINKEQKRKEDHYNSLVLTERNLVTLQNIVNSNQSILTKFSQIIKVPQTAILTLRQFPTRESLSENTKNKVLLNDFLNLSLYYDYLNQYQQNITNLYEAMKESIKGKYKTEEEYRNLLIELGEKMDHQIQPLIEHYKKIEEETISVLAEYRVAMNKFKSCFHSLPLIRYFFESEFHLPKKYLKKVEIEKSKIKKELNEIK